MSSSQLRQSIADMGRRNVEPCDIAAALGTTPKYVREVLKAEGIAFKALAEPYALEGVWARPEGKRRMAIWKRAVEGARAARKAMAG